MSSISALSEVIKISTAVTPTAGAAGTTDIEGTILDMQGYDGVLMVVRMGTITGSAVTSIKAQQDTAVGGGTMADLTGTGQTIADSDDEKTFYIDIVKPQERYVRLYVDRATQNAVVASAEYFQYIARDTDITQGTGVSGEVFVTPIEGTA